MLWADDLRLVTMCCGVSAGQLRPHRTRKGREYYRLKCLCCTSWLQTSRLGMRIPAGLSEIYRRESSPNAVYQMMLSHKVQGQRVWHAVSWHPRERKDGSVQDEADHLQYCAYCGGDQVRLRIDKRNRPYTTCDACSTLAFYNRQADAHTAALGVARLSRTSPEAWLGYATRGAEYLARLHSALRQDAEESAMEADYDRNTPGGHSGE